MVAVYTGEQAGGPEPASGGLLTGELILARFDYVRTVYGLDALARVLAALPAGDTSLLDQVSRGEWYPLRTLIALDKTIAAVLAPDDPAVFERLGRHSARRHTAWLGEHASLMCVHAFLARAAEGHRRFQTFGHAAYRRTGFTEGQMCYFGYPPELDVVYCLSGRGYLAAALEELTQGPATVEESECQCRGGGCCRFVLRWQSRS
jgi:hypothetical protein